MDKIKILNQTKKDVKNILENTDQQIINLSLILTKIPENINEQYNNLRILSDLLFPTLEKELTIKEYCLFIKEYIIDEKINYKKLQENGISKEKINIITKINSYNTNIEYKLETKKIIQKLSKNILKLIEIKEKIEKEIDILFEENYKNTKEIATISIACKMLEISGSFKRLSRFPASTIQLLGSEKSFFKALKTNRKTPKYGILYNHPLIIKQKEKNKGKVARSLAAKISICLKADIDKVEIYKDIIEKLNIKIKQLER
ncbi:MAG: hypothetical protein PHR26_02085 [Candidatus ainarchaeum sp.]|nr:hypothetical protein [Candidatus ainarchaeum sp.]MDD3975580.1 hypothetical protein [Candidatus ainarchaeum sp.]